MFDLQFDPQVSWLYPPDTAPSHTEQLDAFVDDTMSWSRVQITPDGEQVRACFCADDFDFIGGGYTTCECWHRSPSGTWWAYSATPAGGGAVALTPAGELLHAADRLGGVALGPLGEEPPPVIWPATLAGLTLADDGTPRVLVRAEDPAGLLYAPWP